MTASADTALAIQVQHLIVMLIRAVIEGRADLLRLGRKDSWLALTIQVIVVGLECGICHPLLVY